MVLFKTLSFLVFFSLILFTHQTVMEAKVHVLYSWIFPDFQYPSENAKSAAIEQGDFIAENAVILDSDYYFCEKNIFFIHFLFYYCYIL